MRDRQSLHWPGRASAAKANSLDKPFADTLYEVQDMNDFPDVPAAAPAGADSPAKAGPHRPGMIWIPGGTFLMGSDRHYPEEAPAHRVTVDGFWIDRTPVTNRKFREFVNATGYVTFAEIPPDPRTIPVRCRTC
jgi:formylglycine-generating enzyme required for sulfatase activity